VAGGNFLCLIERDRVIVDLLKPGRACTAHIVGATMLGEIGSPIVA